MDMSVIPECYVDTNLIETLVPIQGGYNHQKGSGTVGKVMRERFTDRFALGIIDRDKQALDYLKEFTVVAQVNSLLLHKHKTKHQYIIQVSPAMERFIMANAAEVGVSLADFGLSTDFEGLKQQTKTLTTKNDERFKRLFKGLNTKGASGLRTLAAWVDYLRKNNYTADMEVLKGF